MAKQKQVSGKPPPKCKANLLCKQGIFDKLSGQITLVGLIEEIILDQLPTETDSMTLFLQLVDGIGSYRVAIEVHDLRENRAVARFDGAESIKFEERPSRMDLMISIPPLYFDHEGSYDLIVFADDDEIDRTLFHISVEGGENEEEVSAD